MASTVSMSLGQRGQLEEAVDFAHACDLDEGGIAKSIAWASTAQGDNPLKTWDEKVHWAMTNSPEGGRAELVENLVRRGLSTHTPEEISRWIDSLAEGKEKDAGLSIEAEAYYKSHQTELALQRTQQMADEGKRENAIRRIFVWAHSKNAETAGRIAAEHGYDLNTILGQ